MKVYFQSWKTLNTHKDSPHPVLSTEHVKISLKWENNSTNNKQTVCRKCLTQWCCAPSKSNTEDPAGLFSWRPSSLIVGGSLYSKTVHLVSALADHYHQRPDRATHFNGHPRDDCSRKSGTLVVYQICPSDRCPLWPLPSAPLQGRTF